MKSKKGSELTGFFGNISRSRGIEQNLKLSRQTLCKIPSIRRLPRFQQLIGISTPFNNHIWAYVVLKHDRAPWNSSSAQKVRLRCGRKFPSPCNSPPEGIDPVLTRRIFCVKCKMAWKKEMVEKNRFRVYRCGRG